MRLSQRYYYQLTAEIKVMIWRQVLDIDGDHYGPVLVRALGAQDADKWRRIEGKGVTCLNRRTVTKLPHDLPETRRVVYFGIESAEDAKEFLLRNEGCAKHRVLFVAQLGPGNLYKFSTAILDDITLLFIFNYVPQRVEERSHAFNLLHKSFLLRRCGFALLYYNRVLQLLTSSRAIPVKPPSFADSLGIRSLAYQLCILRERVWKRFDIWHRVSQLHARVNALKGKKCRKNLRDCRHALVTGWYGTETAGDKAILLELVHVLREWNPSIQISITSIVPGLSLLTNIETGLDAEVMELRSLNYSSLRTVDLVVFGGGPLMDSSQLKYIETLFNWARCKGVTTLVFGCGVGPLKTQTGIARVRSILRATNHAFFRDRQSAERALEMGYQGLADYACDPGLRFVHRWKLKQAPTGQEDTRRGLVALIRSQTPEYSYTPIQDARQLRSSFIHFFQDFLRDKKGCSVSLLPMHTFWLGNDDRDYTRQVAMAFGGEMLLESCMETLTLEGLLVRISRARWGLAMRFHGHIFMLALQIPFVSVDYTGNGGKVASLMQRYSLCKYSIPANDLSGDSLIERWRNVDESYSDIVMRIQSQLAVDLQRLERVYIKLWTNDTAG